MSSLTIEQLLDEIAQRGLRIGLDGPDVTMVTPAYRWTLRVFTHAHDRYGTPLDRKMFHGETPADVLTQALAWQPRSEAAS